MPVAVARQGTATRICVLSEDLSGAPDEGIKRFTLSLAEALRRAEYDVSLVATRGVPGTAGVHLALAPKTFVSRQLAKLFDEQQPEIVIYVPTASTTWMACLRSRVLKWYCPSATVVLVGLQPRVHSWLAARLLGHLAPDLICVQAPRSKLYLDQLGCSVGLVISGVDTHRFQPAERARRRELRIDYQLDPDAPTVLHVGHLKAGRGIRVLAELARRGRCQVIMVASSSTRHDHGLADELRRAGVAIFREYQPRIEQLYQLADCYLFPVDSVANAIEIPLSVLEALACDLPVVTTYFGGLPRLLGGSAAQGLVFVGSPGDLVSQAEQLATIRPPGTRPLVMRYSWDATASDLLDQVMARRLRADALRTAT